MCIAVLVAPENAKELVVQAGTLSLLEETLSVNDLWGDRAGLPRKIKAKWPVRAPPLPADL